MTDNSQGPPQTQASKGHPLPLSPKLIRLRGQAHPAFATRRQWIFPYGQTRYYAQQADLIGRPNAVRAVGAANGANPIAVVVPCHRVIGKNGTLTGYAGGLERKKWLKPSGATNSETRI